MDYGRGWGGEEGLLKATVQSSEGMMAQKTAVAVKRTEVGVLEMYLGGRVVEVKKENWAAEAHLEDRTN